ncbi:MAG: HigA family addiction module antidote protein [Burkholderiales bacterium]|uniref:HigA family addiction module antitoxin n=1 Tax=Ottowia pentelensis TaxID=511108 RepID=A0ABV6PRZ7_9BURK|nr:HigA family addiction module antitoxin [Ottowia sp.]MBN9406715.1 HigA family addiction module antidote protein [Burkholderiales bacterium]MBS0404492.1 HigA family addiction module antidote protein [Pseudomonadota bacterium]MBS0414477.1 HigA family addiction module antidote protein [Pseudomonadota bacterium]HMN55843.1 HigA family addiction module antitoxin [Ottowia sp.]
MSSSIQWPHPGEVLMEDFLKPMGISQYRIAKDIGVPARRVNEIVKGQRGISADTALRLAAFFGTDAISWMNLQAEYDLRAAQSSMQTVLAHIRKHELA